MKNKKTNLGVSDVIGTILLLGMAVALFSVLSAVVLSYPFQPSTPTVDIIGFVDIENNNIVLEHRGGEDLPLTTKIIVIINNTDRYQMNLSDDFLLSNKSKEDGFWNIGENVIIDPSRNLASGLDLTVSVVDVTVVDDKSKSVIMMGTLWEGS